MTVTIDRRSRLRFKELVSIGEVEFWELDLLPTVPETTADIYYRVESTDRIDTISSNFYGDPNFWWVIAVANDMDILPTNLRVGQTIRIPSPTYVQENLFKTTFISP